MVRDNSNKLQIQMAEYNHDLVLLSCYFQKDCISFNETSTLFTLIIYLGWLCGMYIQ